MVTSSQNIKQKVQKEFDLLVFLCSDTSWDPVEPLSAPCGGSSLTQSAAPFRTHAAQTTSMSSVHYFYANAAHSISFMALLLLSKWSFLLLLSLSASSLPASRQPPEEVRAVKRVFLFHTSHSSSHLCFLVPRLHCSVCSAQSVSCDCRLCQLFDCLLLKVLLAVMATPCICRSLQPMLDRR